MRVVLKYIVFTLARLPSVNLHHFLGLFENGYSKALMRSDEERSCNEMIGYYQTRLGEQENAGPGHPLLRAHCFGVIRMAVLGLGAAVVNDLPEDQANLLLHCFNTISRLERADEAALVAFIC